jgi:hypothetical protein
MCIFGVANGTACTMHSLAWNDPEDKKDAHNAMRASTPGQVIDLPKPPDHNSRHQSNKGNQVASSS